MILPCAHETFEIFFDKKFHRLKIHVRHILITNYPNDLDQYVAHMYFQSMKFFIEKDSEGFVSTRQNDTF